MKKLLMIALCLALAFALYQGAVVLANNAIAADLGRALRAYPLPQQTRALGEGSIAGKRLGNGSGMQWFGLLLVDSELTEAELEAYYAPLAAEMNADLDVHTADGHRKITAQDPPGTPHDMGWVAYDYGRTDADLARCWQIQLMRSCPAGTEASLREALLNGDLRAH